ncbi:MAG: Na+-transporting NADH:ubiquinone oxidoreductase subunit D [Marinilabiliales bacterium]|nr:MAG: Na+-transporting NADH:ubiquinone oxidoreductase subunit D [Marinilabiliales bacterium]
MSLLTVSGSPHVHEKGNVSKIMLFVIIAMLPAFIASAWMFGIGAVKVFAVSIIACILFEWLVQKFLIKGPNTVSDYSAIVTGMLLAFNVPSNLPVWILIIGAFVSIVIGKMSFGGLGKNPFNPALVGRVFMLISFPVPMTSWPKPLESASQLTDVITGPTPLGILKESSNVAEAMSNPAMPDYLQMFWGNMGGSAGEISAIALLAGGLFLLLTRVISWHIPVSFLLGATMFAGALWLADPTIYIDPLFHLIAGGMMLAAFFMATDMVSSPMTPWGMLIFGFMGGVLTIIIRVFGAYPEGASFAILIMNAFVPLLNKIKPKRFGEEVKNG